MYQKKVSRFIGAIHDDPIVVGPIVVGSIEVGAVVAAAIFVVVAEGSNQQWTVFLNGCRLTPSILLASSLLLRRWWW